jgi:hypothetical protein
MRVPRSSERGVKMPRLVFGLAVALVALLVCEAHAQESVRCKSGFYCPASMRCLADGSCGRHEPIVGCRPGYTPRSKGGCMPIGHVECLEGWCRPGQRCSKAGKCTPRIPGGPRCGSGFCSAGSLCSPRGKCYDPSRSRVCGDRLCNIYATCGESDECLNIVGERVRLSVDPPSAEGDRQ